MAKIYRTPLAKRDLYEIWVFVAEERDAAAADKVVRSIDAAIGRLARFPDIAPRKDEYRIPVRQVPVGSFAVIYAVEHDAVTVIRILHGKRQIDAIL